MPHFQPDGTYLFVTWRLHGSLPGSVLRSRFATPGRAFVAADRALALDQRRLWLRNQQIARLVSEAIRAGATQRQLYELEAWVVMPNHVHLLLLPHVPLAGITHWLKGGTARQANAILGRTGKPFWQDESFDHWVRGEREFCRIATYIEENPVSAGLVKAAADCPWSSATPAC
ncbi:MAG: transposase [Acidobacteriota bacterium]|nr:transposase [Acidobacteriota bacterium]